MMLDSSGEESASARKTLVGSCKVWKLPVWKLPVENEASGDFRLFHWSQHIYQPE